MNIPEIIGWAVMVLLSVTALILAVGAIYALIRGLYDNIRYRRFAKVMKKQVLKSRREALSAAVDVLQKLNVNDHETIYNIKRRIGWTENGL